MGRAEGLAGRRRCSYDGETKLPHGDTKKEEREMAEEKAFMHQVSVKWIKAKSGNTYLCPVSALDRIEDPSEEQLKMICIDESLNPQNQ